MLYILNSLIVPLDFDSCSLHLVSFYKLDLETAREIVQETEFISAVGHESTAKLLSQLLGVEIPHNRITVKMRDGDTAIHFVLKQRLPEGKILTEDELRSLEFDLVFSRVK